MGFKKFYAFHTLSSYFPLLHGEEMHALVQDIKQHGLRYPIILYNDEILDGRSRYLACQKVGVVPDYERFTGTRDEAFRFMVSSNLHRRHLNESQRAMVAAELVKAGADDGTRITQTKVADLMNVSRFSVRSAAKVHDNGTPRLIAKVQSGNVTVTMAEQIATLPRRVQQHIIAEGSKAAMMARLREIQQEIRSPQDATTERRKNGLPVWSHDPPNENGLYWMKTGDEEPEIVEYCAEHHQIKAIYTTDWDGIMALRSVRKKTLWCRIYEPVFEGYRT